EGLPGTGKVSEKEIVDLLNYSEISIGIYEEDVLLGFVICLPPRTTYGSLNYAWFNSRYSEFLYVDRIAVSISHRNQNIGSILYREVINYAINKSIPVTAEVNLKPPNPGSIRFHSRHGFSEVGVFEHENKAVTMMIRNTESL
ncbi:MAG: GNAT family N-acetyltransferase, partial [Candidatus Poseidoniaceae archaeon]|nr:GNAT family N-acetyltransferase [Candidatus Poseidoniaceae archaeon]